MQFLGIPSRWCHLNLGDPLKVVLVVQAVAEHVAKVAQCSLQCICCGFFLGFFKSSCLALAVLDVSVSYVLPKCISTVFDLVIPFVLTS